MSSANDDQWRRPEPTPRQQRIDIWTGLAAVLVGLASLALANNTGYFPYGAAPAWPEQVLWTVAVTLPLAWRRSRPELSALIVAAAFITVQVRAVPELQLSTIALLVALYTLGAWGRDRRRSRRLRLTVIVAMFGWICVSYLGFLAELPADAFAEATGPLPPLLANIVYTLLANGLYFGFAYFAGETAWVAARREDQLRTQAELLRSQAEELQRSQAEARERAVVGERLRIARELHDVVAHHVSVMGVQAAACRRVLDRDPDKARTALAAIEQTARTAIDELRRMLGLLRAVGTDGERPDSAGVAHLDRLVARAREAGLTATLSVYGDPVPLPESLSQAVYRIVQEAVTNTLKHAGASLLDVRIRYLASDVEVDVKDDGRAHAPGATGGLGLIGIRERVAAHDGELEAGPQPTGGFRVRARFPRPALVEQAA